MIELKLKRTALRWDFSFFAVMAVFFLWDSSGNGFAALGICAAHELAHLLVMRLCGITPESLTFYGAGIRLSAPAVERCGGAARAAVYSAGCVMNLLLACVFFAAGNMNIAAISLATGLFNLLPVGEFDGRRLLGILFTALLPAEHIDRAMFVAGVISAAISALTVFLLRGAGPTFFITAAYLVVMSVREL